MIPRSRWSRSWSIWSIWSIWSVSGGRVIRTHDSLKNHVFPYMTYVFLLFLSWHLIFLSTQHQGYTQCPSWFFILERYKLCGHRLWCRAKPFFFPEWIKVRRQIKCQRTGYESATNTPTKKITTTGNKIYKKRRNALFSSNSYHIPTWYSVKWYWYYCLWKSTECFWYLPCVLFAPRMLQSGRLGGAVGRSAKALRGSFCFSGGEVFAMFWCLCYCCCCCCLWCRRWCRSWGAVWVVVYGVVGPVVVSAVVCAVFVVTTADRWSVGSVWFIPTTTLQFIIYVCQAGQIDRILICMICMICVICMI